MTDRAAQVAAARDRWNAGDLDGYLDLYDESIQLHGYTPAPMGKAEVVGFYRAIWESLGASDAPGPALEFHEVIVDGDMYCCRYTMSGVQRGDFMGVPASGRAYAMGGMTMMRFDGARVTERWSTADFLGLLIQLGAIPAPG